MVAVCGFLVGLLMSGCATQPSSYQNWGKQFLDAAAKKSTVREISSFLGAEPVKCENLPPYPIVGLLIEDHAGPIVASVDPSGPAANSGIRKGDKILFINSKRTERIEEGSEIIRSEAAPDRPLIIETQRGTYRFTPKYPTSVTQCYWEVMGDQARKDAGSATDKQYPGQASDKGVTYQRFFRGVCRFFDGRASQCQYNWQK
jgi:membrane-associated protease RseP (regulator of RpoE activity)